MFLYTRNEDGDNVVSETVIASVITLMRSSSLYNYVLLWAHCLESCIYFYILSSIRVTIKFLLVLITNGEKIYSGNMSLFSNEYFITFSSIWKPQTMIWMKMNGYVNKKLLLDINHKNSFLSLSQLNNKSTIIVNV